MPAWSTALGFGQANLLGVGHDGFDEQFAALWPIHRFRGQNLTIDPR
jgi:hypothetical protein